MNERENMQKVWDHEKPDWVPMMNIASQMLILPEVNDRPLFQTGKDWFGLEWELDPKYPQLMTHIKPGTCLFEDMEDWRDHIKFPSMKDLPWDMIAARTKAMWKNKESMMGYIVGNIGAFERLNATIGFENGLCALYDTENYIDYVNAYVDYRIEMLEYVKKYMDPDFVMMHDDWGNEKNMFLAPDLWRTIFKEPTRRLAKACHDLGMYYMHHSCGYNEQIIPDLVEIGVDAWHSVQPMNDLAKLKEMVGNKFVFAGGVDMHKTDDPNATEETIRQEVRRAIDVLGKDGGYLCQSSGMFSTAPGVDAIIDDEGTKYGKY